MVVSRLKHAQALDPASADSAVDDVAADRLIEETSTVPAADSPSPDAPVLSDEDSTHRTGTMRAVESRQREQFRLALPHIIKAEGLFENDMFEAAGAEYRRASDILAGHPKYYLTLYNLGLCYERLFRYTEALEYYGNYLKAAGPQAENRGEVERLIKTLQGLLATLQISVNTKATVWIDGSLIGQAPGELLVAGGRHRVELRSEGYETEQLEVRVPAQKVQKLTFRMKSIGRFQGIDPIYFWVSSALAVSALGVGTYFGIDALLEDQRAREARDEGIEKVLAGELENDDLQMQVEDSNQKIEDLQVKANVFFAIGGGLAVSSVILFFLTDWESAETPLTVSGIGRGLSITTRVSERGLYGNLVGYY